MLGLDGRARNALFLDYLGAEIRHSDNPGEIFGYLYRSMADDKGQVSESVKNSQAFGSMIKMFQNSIPDEIKNSIPEGNLLPFTYVTLSRVASTEKGKKIIADVMPQLRPDADFKKIAQETGIDRLMAQESFNELLSRPQWKRSYDELSKEWHNDNLEELQGAGKASDQPARQMGSPAMEEDPQLTSPERTTTQSADFSAVLRNATSPKIGAAPQIPVAQNKGISGRLRGIQENSTLPSEPAVKPLDNTFVQNAAKKYSHMA